MTVRQPSPRVLLASVVVGAGISWLAGAAPWWRRALRLPISSAWPEVGADEVVRVALPFGEYQLALLLAVTWVGATCAVLFSRAARLPRRGLALGGVLGLSAALVQTLITVESLTMDADETRLFVVVSGAVAVLGTGAGVVSGYALTSNRPVGKAIAGAAAAAMVPTWLGALIAGDPELVDGRLSWWPVHGWWVPAVLLGLSMAAAGVAPARRLWWWPVCAAITTGLLAGFTAMQYAAFYGRATGLTGELVDATRDVFWAAFTRGGGQARLYGVAVLLAGVVVALKHHRNTRVLAEPVGPGSGAAIGP